jgi:phage shock protein C
MYCTTCGEQLGEQSKFCSQCGRPVGAAPPQPYAPAGRLVRVREGKKIAGVCAGFARYLNLNVTLVRIVWLVITLTAGVGLIAYAVAWIAMPKEDEVGLLPPPPHSVDAPNTLAKI